ncbi:MAG: type II toxin-antitoxin system RelE/ParE family toxin [Sphingomonas bacterium]|nr:type II toxin-antitoxin system RelE/ParE family toxin [Sphingomonas bacterium]
MVDVKRSLAAENDLVAILEYGAGRWGREAGLAFALSFKAADDVLSSYPMSGRPRPELGADIRSWLHRGYILYHRFDGNDVDIIRILHAATDASAVDDLE